MTTPKMPILEQETKSWNIPKLSSKECLELLEREADEAEQRAEKAEQELQQARKERIEAEQWLKEVKAWCKKVDSFKESLIATYGEETINKILKESNNLNN